MGHLYLLVLFFHIAGNHAHYQAANQVRLYTDEQSCWWNGQAWKKEIEKADPLNGEVMFYCAEIDDTRGL